MFLRIWKKNNHITNGFLLSLGARPAHLESLGAAARAAHGSSCSAACKWESKPTMRKGQLLKCPGSESWGICSCFLSLQGNSGEKGWAEPVENENKLWKEPSNHPNWKPSPEENSGHPKRSEEQRDRSVYSQRRGHPWATEGAAHNRMHQARRVNVSTRRGLWSWLAWKSTMSLKPDN